MAFEVSTITLVGGEISVLEQYLERTIKEIQAGPFPDRARVYASILDKITDAKAEVE